MPTLPIIFVLCHVLLSMLMTPRNLVWKYVQMARQQATIPTNASNSAIMDSIVLIKYVLAAVLLISLLIISQESAFQAVHILLSHMQIPPIELVCSTVQLDCMLTLGIILAYPLVLQVFSKKLHSYYVLISVLRTISVTM